MGWAYLPSGEGPFGSGHDQEYMQDHLKFPELALMENFYRAPVFATHAAFYFALGPAWAVYCSMLSGILCQTLTLYFNVMFHSHPEPTTARRREIRPLWGDVSRVDLPLDPLANVFGEAYHGVAPQTPARVQAPRDRPRVLVVHQTLHDDGPDGGTEQDARGEGRREDEARRTARASRRVCTTPSSRGIPSPSSHADASEPSPREATNTEPTHLCSF